MKKITGVFLLLLPALFVFSQGKPEGLFINSKAADFSAKDQNGNEINLKDIRKKGQVVLIFYKGYWNPYCMRELRRFQDSLSLVSAKAQLIAITPEAKEGIDSTVAKTHAAFPIIYDQDMKISDAYHVSLPVDDRTVAHDKNTGIDLLKINNQKQAALPIPAAYIIDKEGNVTYRYFDEDPRKRVFVKEIINNLK